MLAAPRKRGGTTHLMDRAGQPGNRISSAERLRGIFVAIAPWLEFTPWQFDETRSRGRSRLFTEEVIGIVTNDGTSVADQRERRGKADAAEDLDPYGWPLRSHVVELVRILEINAGSLLSLAQQTCNRRVQESRFFDSELIAHDERPHLVMEKLPSPHAEPVWIPTEYVDDLEADDTYAARDQSKNPVLGSTTTSRVMPNRHFRDGIPRSMHHRE